jgi:hypothetical protein
VPHVSPYGPRFKVLQLPPYVWRLENPDCPKGAITWVIRGTWAEDIDAHSVSGVDAVDEAVEELGPVLLTVVDGVISLAAKDGQELGTGLEEATPFTDGLEVAVESGWSSAVSISQQASVLGSNAAHVGPSRSAGSGSPLS